MGADERRLLLSRAVQIFMPGTPQIWYLDLFAGENDLDAVQRGGSGAHKEINRTNLSMAEVDKRLKWDVVKNQLALLRFRNTCPVFSGNAVISSEASESTLSLRWESEQGFASLNADFSDSSFSVHAEVCGKTFHFIQQ